MLGTAGTLVLVRLSAVILLSVGVKILSDGLVERFTTGSA
jgi:small neutral amino acid transporter SnatA (MarC family)